MLFKIRLGEILAEQNLKQADLCRMTGISTALMSKYMTGKASPSLDNAQSIASALGITLDYLVGRDSRYCSLSKKQMALLGMFDGLNDEGQNTLLNVLGSLEVSHSKHNPSSSSVVQKNSGGTNFLATGGNNNYSIVAP